MSPQDVQDLLSVPQFQAFMKFAATEAEKLNHLDDLDINCTDLAVEVKSRAKAYKIISDILTPLLIPQTPIASGNNKDYEIP